LLGKPVNIYLYNYLFDKYNNIDLFIFSRKSDPEYLLERRVNSRLSTKSSTCQNGEKIKKMSSFDASRPEICELGERPELGVVPENMHVFCVRQNRFGEPKDAWQREVLPVPEIGPKDVLIYTMATGINYNNVWAVGSEVDNVEVGDEVVIHSGWWEPGNPCLSGTFGFNEIGHAHQLMHENKHPYGNMACLVNATEQGQGAS
tara:strand:+ start:144 stop:752 length:609 start_codon:yes stop_codon:yes gene_type:complete